MSRPRSSRGRTALSAVMAVLVVALLAAGCAASAPPEVLERTDRYTTMIDLPAPAAVGTASLEEALAERRSQRAYRDEALPLETIGQLLWSGQGITDSSGHRTSPSAGALYPLELYVVDATTVMHYLPAEHQVEQRPDTTVLLELGGAAFGQEYVSTAPSVVIITGVVARTEAKYGAVAVDYMNREAGHAAQNILLQATALELAAVPVGGFDSAAVAQLLALPPGEEVLYLIPVGQPG